MEHSHTTGSINVHKKKSSAGILVIEFGYWVDFPFLQTSVKVGLPVKTFMESSG